MVVAASTGVVKLVLPVASAIPPVAAAYQSIVWLEPGVAVNVTVPMPQRVLLVPAGATGIVMMLAVTAVLETEMQPAVVFLASA